MSDPAWEEFKSAHQDDEAWARQIDEAITDEEDAPMCIDGAAHQFEEIRIHIRMCKLDDCGYWEHVRG